MSTINTLENSQEGIYKFGAFSFDTNNSVLQNESFVIHLQKKQFDVLHLLVLNAGAIVSKEEFFRLIWHGQDVEESNLTMQIHLLRRIIETDIRNPSYILTVPGQGYTMAGEVTFTHKIQGSESIAEDPCVETTPIKSRSFPKINIDRLVAVVASIALLLTLVYFLRPKSTPGLSRSVPLTSLVGSERYPAISPDGNFTAFTWDGDQLKNDDIYIQQTSVSKLLRITTDPASDIQPTWSRDGQYLAFLRGERNIGEQYRLIIVPVFGGREREVAKVSGGLDWSPDGRYLAVTRITDARGRAGIFKIAVNGEAQQQITQPSPIGNSFDSSPRFSPDGQNIAFLRRKNDEESDIFIASVSNGQIRQLTRENKNIQDGSLHWDGDGKTLYFISVGSGQWTLAQIGLTDKSPKYFSQFVLPRNAYTLNRRAVTYSINSRENLIAFANELEDDRIDIQDLRRASAKPCSINSTRSDTTPQLSPDGSRLVFTSTRSGSSELWHALADCTQLQQLTNFAESITGNPRWSPDGTKIVFDHLKSDRSDVYVINAGDIVPRKITDSTGNNTMPFWSPDGEWIYFTSNRSLPNHFNQIWKIRATGGTATQVSKADDAEKWRPQATVDGKSLYFVRNNQLWQLEISTGQEWPIQELANLQFNCNWEVSGDGIYYYQNSAVLRSVIYKLEFTTRKVSQIALIDGELASNQPSLSISGKGERFAVSTAYLRLCDINLMHNWK